MNYTRARADITSGSFGVIVKTALTVRPDTAGGHVDELAMVAAV